MMVLAHVPVCQMHLNNKSRLVYLIFSLMENSNFNESISLEFSPINIFAPDFGNYSKLFIYAVLVLGEN